MFNDDSYLKALLDDFKNMMGKKFLNYERLFKNALNEINKKDIQEGTLHLRLQEMTKIDFPRAFKLMNEYDVLAKKYLK